MPQATAPIFCLGADYKFVPLDLLERLSVAEEEYAAFCGSLLDHLRKGSARGELALLATCNRFELYWTEGSFAEVYRGFEGRFPDPSDRSSLGTQDFRSSLSSFVAELERTLAARAGLPAGALSARLRFAAGSGAVEHLLRVASGLESLVIGEHQILGQVEQALAQSLRIGTAGPVLNAAFSAAVRCGRRVRRESALARNPRSVSTVAVQFAENVLGELGERRVLVVGSGDMGRLTLKALHHHGVGSIGILNRRLDGAEALAKTWGATAHPIEKLEGLLEGADLLIASTASRSPILSASTVEQVMGRRSDRPLVLIDLGLPRDIAPEAGSVAGVHLFDLDSLKQVAEEGERESRKAIPAAERIVCEELGAVRSELGNLAIRPVLSELWRLAEEVREEVVGRARHGMPGLDAAQWEEVERLARTLTNKLLHRPSALLRREATNGRAVEYADLVAELFGLSPEGEGPEAPR